MKVRRRGDKKKKHNTPLHSQINTPPIRKRRMSEILQHFDCALFTESICVETSRLEGGVYLIFGLNGGEGGAGGERGMCGFG